MNEDESMAALGHLVGGLNGFTDAAVDEFNAQFQKLDDAAALNDVCQEIAGSWQERWRPTVGDVITRYHSHPRVREAREARVAAAMLEETAGQPVTYGEGQAIANDNYRMVYGRDIGGPIIPTPEYAETLIINVGRRDRDGNWLATYTDVLRGFRGDQARAQASLKAIGRRLAHDMRGGLALAPPIEATQPPEPPPAPDPPPPSERPPDAAGTHVRRVGDNAQTDGGRVTGGWQRTPSRPAAGAQWSIWALHRDVKRWCLLRSGLTGPDAVADLTARQDRLRRRDEPCRIVMLEDGKVPQ